MSKKSAKQNKSKIINFLEKTDFGHFKMSKIGKNYLNYYFTFVLFCALLQRVVDENTSMFFLPTTSLKKRH